MYVPQYDVVCLTLKRCMRIYTLWCELSLGMKIETDIYYLCVWLAHHYFPVFSIEKLIKVLYHPIVFLQIPIDIPCFVMLQLWSPIYRHLPNLLPATYPTTVGATEPSNFPSFYFAQAMLFFGGSWRKHLPGFTCSRNIGVSWMPCGRGIGCLTQNWGPLDPLLVHYLIVIIYMPLMDI